MHQFIKKHEILAEGKKNYDEHVKKEREEASNQMREDIDKALKVLMDKASEGSTEYKILEEECSSLSFPLPEYFVAHPNPGPTEVAIELNEAGFLLTCDAGRRVYFLT